MRAFKNLLRVTFFSGLILYSSQLVAIEAVSDIRTVIDVSGSMKKNDPSNLRSPALKLLVELMPPGTEAGVWTFGQYVNMNVKQGTVDAAWKKLARAEAGKIHSRGLYTNIEEAIRKASYNWSKPDSTRKRSLILLTDGVVDISKDSKVNALSRQRITEELIPRLKQAGVKIHTVALSQDADHQLLKEMSGLTGGWYEKVDNAAQLQKVFLRLFEKSASMDSLPIHANKFTVDKHVKDMTLVLFHEKAGQSATIITPDGKRITGNKPTGGVRWHKEEGYELVTIRKPLAGEWQLETEADPDNRVMIVTNLRLKVSTLPNVLLAGDELTINAHLAEEGKKITRSDFLSLVEFKLTQDQQKGDILITDMKDDGSKPDELKQDGVYSGHLWNSLAAGQHMLSVSAKGPTFRREYRHLLQVFDSPAVIDISVDEHEGFRLTLKPHGEIVQLPSVSAQVKLPDGSQHTFTQDKSNQWVVTVPGSFHDQMAQITLIATRMDDKPLKIEFQRPLSVDGGANPVTMHEKPPALESKDKTGVDVPEPVSEPEEQHEIKHEPDKQATFVDSESEIKEDFSWVFVLSMTLVINLLAIVAGFVGYKLWKKRSTAQDKEEESEMVL